MGIQVLLLRTGNALFPMSKDSGLFLCCALAHGRASGMTVRDAENAENAENAESGIAPLRGMIR